MGQVRLSHMPGLLSMVQNGSVSGTVPPGRNPSRTGGHRWKDEVRQLFIRQCRLWKREIRDKKRKGKMV
ncbi:hypothetical protein DXC97_04155 [Lachnospiraceae bacterium TF09-5]|nr:hypothetical protein DXC97_04155 [Lachnospiraceae bacterium TF09-5]